MLFEGFESYGLLVLRIFLGMIFIFHSIPKLKMPKAMAKGMGWSFGFVVLLGLIEFISALAVIFGFYADIGALLLVLIMLGALYYKIFVWKVPFIGEKTTGWEFDLILLGAAITVLLIGAGTFSISNIF
jgi:putative oxidoreductase